MVGSRAQVQMPTTTHTVIQYSQPILASQPNKNQASASCFLSFREQYIARFFTLGTDGRKSNWPVNLGFAQGGTVLLALRALGTPVS